jgi:hypothetical protein
MFHRWAAPLLVLALCAMSPKNAAGQSSQQPPREQGANGKLGKNYPNPFNPDTKIRFSVECSGAGTSETHVVSMRVMNILAQPVVPPILYGPAPTATSGATSSMNGSPLNNLRLGCGEYEALWPSATVREPASGTYIVQYFVDGQLAGTRRIYYRK